MLEDTGLVLMASASKTLRVNSGETADFICEYTKHQQYSRIIIFKTRNYIIEEVISTTNTRAQKKRFSISDIKHKNIFTVRITAVTPDDGGVYLCGVWDYSYLYSHSIISTVHLHIIRRTIQQIKLHKAFYYPRR
uniref:Immunoglobulin domain-containing protein n=1 Tax=Sinocyclocheilus anshuiensis TaxID=1608454 RepID=A0A671NI49_9TELE